MEIRRAQKEDLGGLVRLLCQVLEVHHKGRPDLVRTGTRKYTDEEILEILSDPERPVFVAVESGEVLGYAFCVLESTENSAVFYPVRSLYLDDLCVDETRRGKHIGKALYDHVCAFAKQEGCYHVTLNVWSLNESAVAFYQKCGMKPLKIGMETIL